MIYNTDTLASGLRVLLLPSDSQVIYCGIGIKGGTRHEHIGEEGLAHFCEHLSFKGTHRRSAVQIINAIEGLGGELNAFTNKEDTVYYCAIPKEHFRKAVDVLCDIVFHSEYPQQEVEKECEVVCDEIESYEDSPAELIFDEFENILFKGHPLGHNILGTSEKVRSYTHDDAQRFTQRYYRPENAVFFACGDVDYKQTLKLLERIDIPANNTNKNKETEKEAVATWEETGAKPIILKRSTHQAHVMIGRRAYAVGDQRRWALYLLNNILGGPGMNSRLNLSLRERNGLVYSVESSMVSYGDTGAWSVYFGCDPHDVNRCRRLVQRELDKLMEHPLSPTQLNNAKRQLRGQLAIATDNREQFTLDCAKSFLHRGKPNSLADVLAHVEALSSEDLQQVAQEMFRAEGLTTLIYE